MHVCRRCSAPLDLHGLCTQAECPYSEALQHDSSGQLLDCPTCSGQRILGEKMCTNCKERNHA